VCFGMWNGSPYGCMISGDDHTDKITGANQPPLVIVHGTDDLTIPYVNAKAMYDRAQEVGLESYMVEIDGEEHEPWDAMLTEPYKSEFIQSIVKVLDLENAEAPERCDLE